MKVFYALQAPDGTYAPRSTANTPNGRKPLLFASRPEADEIEKACRIRGTQLWSVVPMEVADDTPDPKEKRLRRLSASVDRTIKKFQPVPAADTISNTIPFIEPLALAQHELKEREAMYEALRVTEIK